MGSGVGGVGGHMPSGFRVGQLRLNAGAIEREMHFWGESARTGWRRDDNAYRWRVKDVMVVLVEFV